MKKVLCGFAFGLVLMVAGAQAGRRRPFPPAGPKTTVDWAELILADGHPISAALESEAIRSSSGIGTRIVAALVG